MESKIHRAPRNNARRVSVFAWMSDEELTACAMKARVTTNGPRLRIIKALESKGWWRADITDLSNVRLQRKPTQEEQ